MRRADDDPALELETVFKDENPEDVVRGGSVRRGILSGFSGKFTSGRGRLVTGVKKSSVAMNE